MENAGWAPVGVAGDDYIDRLPKRACPKRLAATDLIDDGETPAPPPAEDVDDRDAVVLFTSGTTGLPKAIGITQGQLSARISGVTTPFRADVATDREHDERPVLPRRRRHRRARQPVRGQHLRGAGPVRRRRVVAPGARAPSDVHLHGADDAAAGPRPSRLRQDRPDVARRHRIRGSRRARHIGAQGDGRDAACGLRQRVRPDRDLGRVHDSAARRSSRPQPGGVCRPTAARCRGPSGGPRHRDRCRGGNSRRVVGEARPERRQRRLAAYGGSRSPRRRRLHLSDSAG